MKSKGITVFFDGVEFSEWTASEVSRDIKDLSGKFTFTLREDMRAIAALPYGSRAKAYRLKPEAVTQIMSMASSVSSA